MFWNKTKKQEQEEEQRAFYKSVRDLALDYGIVRMNLEVLEKQVVWIMKELESQGRAATGFEKATPWIERCPECKTPIFCGTCINCGFVQKQDIYNTSGISDQ